MKLPGIPSRPQILAAITTGITNAASERVSRLIKTDARAASTLPTPTFKTLTSRPRPSGPESATRPTPWSVPHPRRNEESGSAEEIGTSEQHSGESLERDTDDRNDTRRYSPYPRCRPRSPSATACHIVPGRPTESAALADTR